MSRAARTVEAALQKQADQAGRTQGEFLALQAAQAGLGENAQRLVAIIERSGTISATAGGAAAAGFAAASAAADASVNKQRALNAELVQSILQVNAAYEARRTAIAASGSSGAINTDQLKAQLSGLKSAREDAIQQLKTAAAQKQAENDLAATAEADAARRYAAAQKIIDVQNGLTTSYRQQLAALRELRDAGNLSPAQFKRAGAELVAKQPAVQQRTQDSAAQDAAAKAEAARALALSQSGASTAYAAAQSRVYAAFLIAEAGAAREAEASEARLAAVAKSVADASARSVAAQQQQYATKTAFIAKLTEEAEALFRTRDAQRQLDAERAGVSSKQAAQLAKFTGDREFIAGIYDQIAAEQRLADQFGKTAAEILRQEAAARGLTNTTASAIGRFQALAEANAAASKSSAQTRSNDAYLASLQREVDLLGKTRSETIAYDLAQRGLTERAGPLIAKLRDLDEKTGQFGKSAFASRNRLLTLQYTISDVIASAGSGISPLTILLQQGGQVFDAFGGAAAQGKGGFFKNFIGTLGAVLTPVRIAIGATAAAVGALGYVFIEGKRQSKEFADGIVLTGNFVGLTEGRFNALAKSISASGQISIASAREVGQALIATGEIGPQAFALSEEAAARFAAATGKSSKDVAAQFAALSRDVTAGATQLNQSLNFLSAAQLQQVRNLQDSGKSTDAYSLVVTALNDRLKLLEPNLGTIDRVLRTVTTEWKRFWDSAYDVGRAETLEDKIARARSAVALGVGGERVSQTQLDPQRRAQIGVGDPNSTDKQAAQENLRLLLRSQSANEQNAVETAKLAKLQKDAANADDFVRQNERRAKSQEGLNRELAAANAQFAKQDELAKRDSNYKPSSAQTRTDILKKIREDYTDKPAVSESDAQRRALLDQDLKFTQANLEKQTDLLKFNQQVVAAIYAGNNLSLKDYYDERRALTERGVQNELDALIDEQARLEVELERGAFKDPHQKTQLQTQLNESIAKYAKVQREAGQAATLSSLEEAAAFKALADRVDDYRASLLQLEGDEEAAAKIRANIAIQNAKLFAKQAGGAVSEDDLNRQERALGASNQFAEIQRRLGLLTADAARAEESYLLRATQAGQNLIETDTGVYTLRATALVQLGELADKAAALAEASTDPKIKAFAADLALQYAKAADAVDPAITRLRGGADDLATAYRGVFDSIASGSLTGRDAIKQLGNVAQQILTKTFISEPLEAALKGGFRSFVEGDNPIAKFLRSGTPSAQPGAGIDVAGAGFSAAKDSQAASEAFDALQSGIGSVVTVTVTQTTATQAATSALAAMTAAAQAAAQSLAAVATSSGGSGSLSGIFGGGGSNPDYSHEGLNYSTPLADGTNYVPYDGFRATLHKGENVTPAKYNPMAGGGWGRSGGDQIQIVNPPGSPATVARTETSTSADGTKLKRIVLQAVAEDVRAGGNTSQTMQGKFGLTRQNPRRG